MKKSLLVLILSCVMVGGLNAQCTPNVLYADSIFGVWPDTITNFPPAFLNLAYETQLDLLVPTNASQVPDVTLPPLPIDSGEVNNVIGLPEGLEWICSSQTASNCTFLSGDLGCAVLVGAPLEEGVFDITIEVTAYLSLFGSAIDAPLSFEGYRVIVSDGTVGFEEVDAAKPILAQNIPNPFSNETSIQFSLTQPDIVVFKVMDLLGQQVYSQKINGIKGDNSFEFFPEGMESGIYLFSIESNYGVVTRRMVYDRP